jgi:hypothetical protein
MGVIGFLAGKCAVYGAGRALTPKVILAVFAMEER